MDTLFLPHNPHLEKPEAFIRQLKQITKYPNGLILTKSRQQGEIHGIPTIPLPLALLRIGPTW